MTKKEGEHLDLQDLNTELTNKIYFLNQDFKKDEAKWEDELNQERNKHDDLLASIKETQMSAKKKSKKIEDLEAQN